MSRHTVGVKEDGTVMAVGYNGYGQLNVSSWMNIMPVCEATQDATPPISAAMMTVTLGNNGWYVYDVQMTLTVTDNDAGSGVKEIHYTVDGTETVVQGSSVSHSITGDGTRAVSYYAIDNEGNEETLIQEMSVKIDKTHPDVSLTTSTNTIWPPNHKMVNVSINGSAIDSGSDVASIVINVTDEYGVNNMTVPGFGSMIQLEAWREGTDKDGRHYTVTAVITDKAGNQSTSTTVVVCPHDMRDKKAKK